VNAATTAVSSSVPSFMPPWEQGSRPGRDSTAGRRLDEMQNFYAFMQREMDALTDTWHKQYDAGHLPS
jgi:hypothetical protein